MKFDLLRGHEFKDIKILTFKASSSSAWSLTSHWWRNNASSLMKEESDSIACLTTLFNTTKLE